MFDNEWQEKLFNLVWEYVVTIKWIENASSITGIRSLYGTEEKRRKLHEQILEHTGLERGDLDQYTNDLPFDDKDCKWWLFDKIASVCCRQGKWNVDRDHTYNPHNTPRETFHVAGNMIRLAADLPAESDWPEDDDGGWNRLPDGGWAPEEE